MGVADVATIEDEAVAGPVVADVVDLGIVAGGDTVMIRGLDSSPTFSTLLKSSRVNGQRKLESRGGGDFGGGPR